MGKRAFDPGSLLPFRDFDQNGIPEYKTGLNREILHMTALLPYIPRRRF